MPVSVRVSNLCLRGIQQRRLFPANFPLGRLNASLRLRNAYIFLFSRSELENAYGGAGMAVLDCRGNVYINQVFLCFDIDESGGPGDLVRAGRRMGASSRGAALLTRCTSRYLRSAFVPARALPTDTHTHAQTPPPLGWINASGI